jgi:hypothetical protein
MKTNVILLSGKQGSGKSSIQKELISRLTRTDSLAYSVNFADILYEMHDAVLAILHKYIPPRPIKKDGYLLQLLGTEWGRATIESDIWVNCLKSKMKLLSLTMAEYKNIFFIIGDCRFENEFNAFPDSDFPNVLRVRLVAPEDVRKERCSMWRENTTHVSETALDNYYNANKFDQNLATDILSVEECIEIIITRLSVAEAKGLSNP